jgi:hypothetical protein
MCTVLNDLAAACAAIPALPSPAGLGAADVLREQVSVLSRTVAGLQRELSLRMAALQEQDQAADVRGDAVRAGMAGAQSARLRRLGTFAREHPAVERAWAAATVGEDHVAALRDGVAGLPPRLREELVEQVLPHLPDLDAKGARRLVAYTADLLDPMDPDQEEQSDHAARRLAWTTAPGGGVAFEGYLPTAEAEAFIGAIKALAEDLRVAGDGVSPGQRAADALAALVARATAHGLPTGGGLPAALTLTVSVTEAARVAQRDPGAFGTHYRGRPRSDSAAGNRHAGDATVRFGVCCAAVTPVLVQEPASGSLLDRIAKTKAEPLAVGRAVRLATPAQRRALQVRDGGCAIPGCGVAAPYTQPHHVTGWALGGATDVDNLVSLCWVHHRQTELGRFRFAPRTGDGPQPEGALAHPRWWIIPPLC